MLQWITFRYHRTEIPCTAGAADELSFSYARDFFLGPVTGEEDPDVEMDNCDDTWATEFVPAGTVIAQGPEAAIFPSSDDPNCRLEGNGDVVVAFRDIQPGESLSVPPK